MYMTSCSLITLNTNKTLYKVEFLITQCFKNVTIKLQCGATKITYSIRHIKPFKYDTKVDGSISKNMADDVNI